MRLPQWLSTESEAWRRDGLITEDQRRAILARYEPSTAAAEQASSALTWLAALVGGIGGVVLVAWNWTAIPAIVKVLLSTGPMLGLYIASAIAARAGRAVRAERLALLAALLSGAVLFVTEDLAHVDPGRANTLLVWSGVLASTALFASSALSVAAGAAVLWWWILVNGSSLSSLWWFLAVWPVLALSLERAPNRWVAAGLVFVFGVWIFFTVAGAWSDEPAVGAVAVVLTGCWINALAHEPAGHRPAFARPTPAMAITLLGLMLLMASASHRAMADWRVAANRLVPAAALLAGLAAGAAWQIWRRGAWKSRPGGLIALSVLWLALWFTLPADWRTNAWQQWMWTSVFSVAVIIMGASAVREAAQTRDRGQFALGLLCVVAFVLVRVIDAHSLVVSGTMLLISALVLWWLGRLWARPATTGAAA